MNATGILVGLVPALGWGFQSIVMQKIGGKYSNKVLGMGITTLIIGIICYILKPEQLTTNVIIGSVLCGICLSLGQIGQIRSFDLVGVSTAMPVSAGEQLLGTTLIGAAVFHEWSKSLQWTLGIVALILVIVGIVCTAFTEDKSKGSNVKLGLLILTGSSIALVGYATLPTFFGISGWGIFLPQSIALIITDIVVLGVQKDSQMLAPSTWKNMITGLFFGAANIGIILSNQMNGVAVGYTLSQLNVVVATLGGLLILHEAKTKKELRYTLLGLALIVIGAVLNGITKL